MTSRALTLASVAVLTVLTAISASSLSAQTTLGTILGLATDSSGAAVPGVTIVVTNLATNIERKTATSDVGLYEVAQLLPGRYSMTAEKPGFNKFVVASALLETASSVRLDIKLEVGNVATTVTVEAGAPLINTEGPEVAIVHDVRMVEKLPINYRGAFGGFQDTIALLTPGVEANNRFAGMRSGQYSTTVDGTTGDSPLFGNSIGPAMTTMEMTQEVRIQLANDKAEARTPGGIYSSSLPGGNAFHGQLFYYNTNSHLVARNTFSNTVPFILEHDYGAAASGPIVKNHTFFSASYERLPRLPEKIMRPNVPTLRFRQGDFSSLLPETVVKDPLTDVPFLDNIVPSSRLSDTALAMQERWFPKPNAGPPDSYQSNWQGTRRNSLFKSAVDSRIDHKLSDSNSLFGRWTWNRAGLDEYDTDLPTIPRGAQDRRTTVITVADTHIFRPTLLNEFRFGLMRTQNPYITPVNGTELIEKFGLEGLAPTFVDPYGFPSLFITDFADVYTDYAHEEISERIYQLANNVTWTRGAHTVKTGVDVRHNVGITFPGGTTFPARAFGTFDFSGAFSGFSYADFLLGLPQQSTRVNPAPLFHLVNTDIGAFVQDDWKVTARLTLNLGVRYVYNPPYHERDGRFANFDPKTGTMVIPTADSRQFVNNLFPTDLVPIAVASERGLPKSLFYSDLNNLNPRFGFAWRPFSGSQTVVRGGYGIYTDPNTAALYTVTATGPFISNETFTNEIVDGIPLYAFPRGFPEGFGAIGAQSFSAIDPHISNPYIQQWNLTLEHEVLGTGIRLSYVGTVSRQVVWSQNINQPAPGLQPFSNAMRRFPALRNVGFSDNGGTSNYHGLLVVGERRFKSGLYYQVGWTWAHMITDAQTESEAGGMPANSYNRSGDRGDVVYLPRHHVIGTLVYELPFGRGRRFLNTTSGATGWLIGGWNLNAVVVGTAGQYFSPSFTGYDVSNTNTVGGRPDRISDGNLTSAERTLTRWFDASAFRVPGDLDGNGRPDVAVGRFGNSAPNVLVGPGQFLLHSGLQKEFRFGERVKATLEGTFTNVVNHANYRNPSGNISARSSVGVIRGAYDPRKGRVGLRIDF